MRPPAFAGQFYAGTRQSLLEQIARCYKHPLGPGHVPVIKKGKRSIKGAIVPHAGYEFSGPVAAHVYNALAEEGFPEIFIIIGPDHQHFGRKAAITTETFRTPLGDVPVDKKLAEETLRDGIEDDPIAHSAEHSIEVQLPFLLQLKSEIKFVPICMTSQDIETAEEVGKIIAKAIEGKDVIILASTDFTHCGPMYGQLPPKGKRADEFAWEQDKKAIDLILKLNPEALYDVIERHSITMCGYGCVATMLFALNKKAKSGELLKYATSYEIMPGSNAVGYAGVLIK